MESAFPGRFQCGQWGLDSKIFHLDLGLNPILVLRLTVEALCSKARCQQHREHLYTTNLLWRAELGGEDEIWGTSRERLKKNIWHKSFIFVSNPSLYIYIIYIYFIMSLDSNSVQVLKLSWRPVVNRASSDSYHSYQCCAGRFLRSLNILADSNFSKCLQRVTS